jgi:TetR/AcrR family transcriptional regulator, regulator of biofilm formation and stress response
VTAAADTGRRVRRFDPDRKDRIVDAALVVMSRHGVAGTTHRLVAAEADVPLGSLTYHFTSLDDLRERAWQRLSEQLSERYERHFVGVTTRAEFVDAVTSLVHDDAGGDTDDWAVAYELYLAALRDPALREVTERWMGASRAVLGRFVDAATARGLDALVEGLVMHKILSTAPVSRAGTRTLVDRMVGPTVKTPRAGTRARRRP